MSPTGGYPIEEFLEAITAQLDQTQDALRLKAVNRPLTFALKDFNVDLKVFVEMDQGGRVTFRPAAPNEEGASTVSIGFTTITRPMIEENTISMEMASSPTLDELGLAPDERQQLAKVGVRTAAQLRNLGHNTGDEGLSRQTGLNLGRLRSALNLAAPRLNDVVDPAAGPAVAPPPTVSTPPPDPHSDPAPAPPRHAVPVPSHPTWPIEPTPRPGKRPGQITLDPGRFPPELAPRPQPQPQPVPTDEPRRPIADHIAGQLRPRRKIDVGPAARNIELRGTNMIDGGRTPAARLDGQKLDLLAAKPSSVSFALPDGWALGPGRLTVDMPDGAQEDFDLAGGAGS